MKESQRNKRVSSLFERNAVVEAQSRFEQWQWFEQFQEYQEYAKWRERKTSPEACGMTQTSNVMIKSPTPVSRLDTSNLIQTGTAVIHTPRWDASSIQAGNVVHAPAPIHAYPPTQSLDVREKEELEQARLRNLIENVWKDKAQQQFLSSLVAQNQFRRMGPMDQWG